MRTQLLVEITVIITVASICNLTSSLSSQETTIDADTYLRRTEQNLNMCLSSRNPVQSRLCKNLLNLFRQRSLLLDDQSSLDGRRFSENAYEVDDWGTFLRNRLTAKLFKHRLVSGNRSEYVYIDGSDSRVKDGDMDEDENSAIDHKPSNTLEGQRASIVNILHALQMKGDGLEKRTGTMLLRPRGEAGTNPTSAGRRIFIGFPMFDNVLYRKGN
ncbi:uncharacterized protein LOC144351986 [Saccoglossus kowalevskii]